jgi:hypothetical protein
MQARDMQAVLTSASATLTFLNPPQIFDSRHDSRVEVTSLKKIQDQTHGNIPTQNFIRPFTGASGTSPSMQQVGYAVYSSAFASMAHLAFSQHKPVELRPDDIHLLILQGVTRFLQRYPEDFRRQMVAFDGQKELLIINDGLTVSDTVLWEFLPETFAEMIREEIPGDLARLLLQDYSETTAVERQVKAVTLMGTCSAFFSYNVATMCFIPEYVLKGTEKDWELISQIPQRLIQLLSLHECEGSGTENGIHLLHRWLTRLAPVLHKMYQSRCGNPDTEFWSSFYKFRSESGMKKVTGNIVYFYPFLHKMKECHMSHEFVLNDFIMGRNGVTLGTRTDSKYFGDGNLNGPETAQFPANIIDVNFKWKRFGDVFDMGMKAGIVACNIGPKPAETHSTHTDFSIFFRSKMPLRNFDQDKVKVVDDNSPKHVPVGDSSRNIVRP